MRIGFTGTQKGMTEKQKTSVLWWLSVGDCTEFHHGDCIGADAEAHEIAQRLGISIIIHPPSDPRKRAFCKGAYLYYAPKPYLKRNHEIVDEVDSILAAPKSNIEELRSGTWATIRYAKKVGRPGIIILP